VIHYVVTKVSIRDLRNHGGDVVDRAAAGEPITITRNGNDVAELRAFASRGISPEAFTARRRHLPRTDPGGWRSDLDAVVDPTL